MANDSEVQACMRQYVQCSQEIKQCQDRCNVFKNNPDRQRAHEQLAACKEERKALQATIYEFMRSQQWDCCEVKSADGKAVYSITPRESQVCRRLSHKEVKDRLKQAMAQGRIHCKEDKEAIEAMLLEPNIDKTQSVQLREKKAK